MKLDTAAQRQHFPVAHALLVVGRCEGDLDVNQHDGAHMLHADIGHSAVIDSIRALVRHSHDESLDVFRFDLLLADEIEQRIEGRLNR